MNVEHVNIDVIEFGDRRREKYGNLQELADSIKQYGLFHPIVVKREPEGSELPYRLLAGGRRYHALRILAQAAAGTPDQEQWSMVPVHILDHDPSDLELREIELEENLRRKDLEWHEKVSMQKEIHDIKQRLHGVSSQGSAAGWTLQDTADLTGVSKSSVYQDIQIATAVEQFPDLFSNCKSKSDATKVMKMLEENILREELARRASARVEGTPERTIMDSFIIQDFFEGVKKLPENVFQLVEIDPPYAIDLHQRKERETQTSIDPLEQYNEIPANTYLAFMKRVFTECYRVMSQDSWIVCWFAQEPWFEQLYQLMRDCGFSGSRQCGYWIKPSGQTLQPQYNLANATEQFFYMRKGTPPIARPGRTNVFQHSPVPAQRKYHPTERPLSLMTDVLQTFAFEGSRVLVPFLGSGKTLAAAYQARMSGIGFELSEQYKIAFCAQMEKREWL